MCFTRGRLFVLRDIIPQILYTNWYPSFLIGNIVPAAIWSIIESQVTIISACLIVSRPWLIKLYQGKLVSWVRGTFTRKSSNRKRSGSSSQHFQRNNRLRTWQVISKFSRLVETPPVLPEASMGGPFGWEVEKGVDTRVGHFENNESCE